MSFNEFNEKVKFIESLSIFSDDDLETFIRFTEGALLIKKIEKLEMIPKELAEEMIMLDPWIFHVSQQVKLEEEELGDFKEIIIEAKKFKKLLCRIEAL